MDTARHAPSAHNSQPWRVIIHDNSNLEIYPEKKRWLTVSDPVGRQGWIGLGCLVENIYLLAKEYGYIASTKLHENPTPYVRVTFEKVSNKKTISDQYTLLIEQRYSDRSYYSEMKLGRKLLKSIKNIQPEEGTTIHVVDDPSQIELVASLQSKAIKAALSNPSFREELRELIIPPNSHKKLGIPTRSLRIPGILGWLEIFQLKYGVGGQKKASIEYEKWQRSAAVLIVTSEGDSIKFWLNAGRTYQRLSLFLFENGISQATGAGAVEAFDFHEEIEQVLGTNERIMTIARIGFSSAKSVGSPRINTDEFVSIQN